MSVTVGYDVQQRFIPQAHFSGFIEGFAHWDDEPDETLRLKTFSRS